MVTVQHECEESASSAFHLMSLCEDGSVGAGDVAIILGILVALALAGVGIWWWVRRRMEE